MASAQISETIRPAYIWTGSEWVQIGDGGSGTGGGGSVVGGTNIFVDYNEELNTYTVSASGGFTNVDSIQYPDYIAFDTTPETTSASVGSIAWDSGEEGLSVQVNENVNLTLGKEIYVLAYNGEATTLNPGEVVMVNGAQGQRPRVIRAYNTSDATSARTFGMVAETIASGAEGIVITQGVIGNIDTDDYNAGDILYLSASPGLVTTVKPQAPNHYVWVGVVLKKNASSGRIYIKPQNGYELDEIHDVRITSIAEGDIIVWNSASSLWLNEPIQNYLNTASAAAAAYTDSELATYNLGGLLVSYGTGSPTFTGTQEEIYYDVNEALTQLNAIYVYYNGDWRIFNEEEFTWDGLSLETWQWLLDNSQAEGWEWLINYDGQIGDVDYRMRYVPNLIADIKYATKTELNNLDIPTATEYQTTQPDVSTLEPGSLWIDSDSTIGTNLDIQSFVRWTKTLSASASTLSGADDSSTILSYTPDLEQVYINGTLLVSGVDYTASSGSSVVLTEAAVSGDVIEILSFESFVISNAYSKSQSDARYINKADTELVKYGSVEPTSPAEGTIWIDSTNILKPITKVYNGSTWIIASGQSDAAIHPFFLAGI